MQVELARPADDPALRGLLRQTPMDGRIQVTLEREPDGALAASLEGELHQILLAREERTGRAIAMGSRSVRTVWLNGRCRRGGYLSQLRVAPEWRGRAGLLRRGYRRLRELHEDGATPLYVTTIVADNTPARRLLEAGLEGFPTYRYLETLLTVVLQVRPPRPSRTGSRAGKGGTEPGRSVERGSLARLPEIVACLERFGRRHQLCPRWTEEDLLSEERTRGLDPGDFYLARRGGRVVGCLARWDQRAFKQVVVRGYKRGLAVVRPLWNLAAPWLGSSRLPPPGSELRTAFLSHVAIDDDDPEVLRALLDHVRSDAHHDGFDYLTLGFVERHPLLAVAREAGPSRVYPSRIYLVHWEDGAEAAASLDGRIPHLEVAVL